MKKIRFGVLWGLFAFALHSQVIASDFQVVVSIKPIQSLVASIMDGIGSPKVLITGTDTVHGYQIKPSDARVIENAEIVFWVGPNLESSFITTFENLAANATIVELSELDGLTLLESREDVSFHAEEEEEEEEDHHGKWDLHIWLSTANAKVMATEIAAVLQQALPEYSNQITLNLLTLQGKVDALELELKESAKSISDIPYVVFHDAYQYLETRLGLNNVGAVTVNTERTPGVKKVIEIREAIINLKAECIFSEPQFNPQILETIAERTDLRFGVLDPLGVEIEPGPDAYFEIMRNLVNSYRACLSLSNQI